MNLLNHEQSYAAQCLIDGHKLEVATKTKYIRILNARGVTQLTNVITLPDDSGHEIDETLNQLGNDDIFAMFHDHNEKYFKRHDLAKLLIEAEFKKKRFECVYYHVHTLICGFYGITIYLKPKNEIFYKESA